ncbi:MAG TPA: hypothetical protein PL085_15360 [Agriterribacter sp.]|nr:hypothetical protein [Agriterribacter sp.]HRO46977.1 hypothetical protein [Agriterribacter sp.]HRQ18451.1 hypothetical protein [Agriterribacter sp.]
MILNLKAIAVPARAKDYAYPYLSVFTEDEQVMADQEELDQA